ncbi:glycosyltransferase [Caldibacillus sp. 210928-DFI.2.22]|uniref:glycosyltransferase n=1 Tax=unclassified Caldibacillus TaxID=2641266 RepID=UPI001D089E7E|nr:MULTISPECIES: glycosyltransferase [unclassified Caldibacillus]MCB7070221.1 glycosyltransferase [Caldibacillus sp. 210928-DFI.2.22]MCB7073820.1 glycosyltransferase [Caldibacillus sp. 210928-DFI.2.18]
MKKNYLFLGFAVPDEEMEKVFKLDKLPSIQTHKFNWNLIKGLELCDTFKYTYISARPVSDYPYYPRKKFRSHNWKIKIFDKSINIIEIPFINTSILKIITRFFSGMYYIFKEYNKEKNKGGIIVYSVHVPFMLLGYLISRIYSIDYIAIWTDPPSVQIERDSFLKAKLRSIELYISKFLMRKASKVIALTKYLAEDFAPQKPYLVIEGIIDENEMNWTRSRKISSSEIKIVYTGSLSKRYGIKNIVEGFLMNKNENLVLEIYGRGDFEEDLKQICLVNNKVVYKGFISQKEVLNVQREADFLINARSPEEEYVKYSFPSKTLEYMLSGTPLITTMLPGIPEEYRNYVLVLEDNNPKTICQMLENIVKMGKEERDQVGLKALEFVKRKNNINQAKKIIDFLNK